MAIYRSARIDFHGRAEQAEKLKGRRVRVTGRIYAAAIFSPTAPPDKQSTMNLLPGMTGFVGFPEVPFAGFLRIAIIRIQDTPDLTLESLMRKGGHSMTVFRINSPTFQENFEVLLP